ncbi:ras association family member isoform X1 [Lycorma delicatula]|uniref:ras association family member isoform X1 n=1 Tax=Lycorma delicatula TaxID=130591 RepID=UPI003F516B67
MWNCHKCGKPVYFAERKQSLGYDWHPECLRCEECGKRLNPGQHAEHKGVPYCHVPCYGALFGPQLFGHGTRVESHTSFGKVENKSCGPNMPRSHLESKLKVFNQFYDGRSGEIRSREVNGRLVLEGALRIYWGVTGVIHLKEDDDQRTVVTIRKRNSCRNSVFNGFDDKEVVDDCQSPGNDITDTNTNNHDQNEEVDSEGIDIDKTDVSSSTGSSNLSGKCLTLPPKLDLRQIDWDELDELLQVERHVENNEKLYQTMPCNLNLNTNSLNTAESKNCKNIDDEENGNLVVDLNDTENDKTDQQLNDDNSFVNHENKLISDQDSYSQNFEERLEEGTSNSENTIDRSHSVPEGFDLSSDEDINERRYSEDSVVRRRTGSTAIKRRTGAKRRSRNAKLKRRCSINGHFYNRETSFFTPPFGSQMSVWVTSLVSTQEVINLMLDKYKVDSKPNNFALFVVRDNGEQRRLREDEYPLLVRVMLGPHEDVAKLYLMDRHSTEEISSEVAQFLNLSTTECRAILERYNYEEEREAKRIRSKFREMRKRMKQRMEDLKVRL